MDARQPLYGDGGGLTHVATLLEAAPTVVVALAPALYADSPPFSGLDGSNEINVHICTTDLKRWNGPVPT